MVQNWIFCNFKNSTVLKAIISKFYFQGLISCLLRKKKWKVNLTTINIKKSCQLLFLLHILLCKIVLYLELLTNHV